MNVWIPSSQHENTSSMTLVINIYCYVLFHVALETGASSAVIVEEFKVTAAVASPED
jgi:hypothetical protein